MNGSWHWGATEERLKIALGISKVNSFYENWGARKTLPSLLVEHSIHIDERRDNDSGVTARQKMSYKGQGCITLQKKQGLNKESLTSSFMKFAFTQIEFNDAGADPNMDDGIDVTKQWSVTCNA